MPVVRHRNPLLRTALFLAGMLLMCAAPVVGIIPGPGGVFVFGGGLLLALQNSNWAQKVFARTKRRWPRFGHYSDMAMRRRSAARRRSRDRELAMAAAEAKAAGFGDARR